MDKPIDISKLCLGKLSKIKDTDKYVKLKECKSINPKKIQEKTNSKIIGEKCRAYLQKQARTTKKITKQDLYNNCEALREAQGKGKGKTKKKGGRGRGGRGGRGGGGKGNVNKIPEEPKKKEGLNATEKKIKDLEIEWGKQVLMGNEEGANKTAEKLKEEYCKDTAEIGYNVIAGTFNTLFNSFEKGTLPNVGWDGGKYLLGRDLGTSIKSIALCIYNHWEKIAGGGVAGWLIDIKQRVREILEYIRQKLGIWQGDNNPPRRGNPPDTPDFGGGGGGGDDRPPRPPRPPDKKDEEDKDTTTAPPSTQLQPQGQATQPTTTAEVLLAQQRQQIGQTYKNLATGQSKALEQEISQSALRDKELMEKKGLVMTTEGIMTREQYEQFKKGEEDLKEEDKKQGSSWSDLFTDIADDIGKGVAVAGGISLPLAGVADILRNQQAPPQGLPPQQPQAPPQPQRGQGQESGQAPPQRQSAQRGQGQETGQAPSPSFDLGEMGRMGIGGLALGASLLGRGKAQRAGLALGLGSLLRPQTEGGGAISLEEDLDLARAVEGSMLGGREEEAGKKPPPTRQQIGEMLDTTRLNPNVAERIKQRLREKLTKETQTEQETTTIETQTEEQETSKKPTSGASSAEQRALDWLGRTEQYEGQIRDLGDIGQRQAEAVVGERARFLDDFMGQEQMPREWDVMLRDFEEQKGKKEEEEEDEN